MGDPSYDDLDNWDPMRDSFYDESFNCYNSGAGSRLPRHQQPANLKKKESQATKLHIFPLTERYSEEALQNIFSSYGEVYETYIHPSYHWAFVTMKTLAAAERAIRDVSNDPLLKFKVQYAREKSNFGSAAASETGSLPRMNHQKSENRSHFASISKRKSIDDRGSMAEPSVRQPSERLTPKNIHQESATMNGGGIYQAVPNCCCCKCQTPDFCSNCLQPFCSLDCMIRGYKGHTSQCVRVPLHSSQKDASKIPSTSCQSINDMNQNSSNSGQNDLNYGKSHYSNDLGVKCSQNTPENMYDGKSAAVPDSRSFETDRKDNQSDLNTSYDSCRNLDETCIGFNIVNDDKGNHRRERDHTSNHSHQKNGLLSNTEVKDRKYRSKMDNGPSGDRHSPMSGNRSSKNNVSSRGPQSQFSGYYWKENNLSKDNVSRVSKNCQNDENESLWETSSQVSRYHSKNNDLSRDKQSRVSGHRKTPSVVCGYTSERENTFSKNNWYPVSEKHSNKKNESTWENRSEVSRYHSKKETDLSTNNRSRVFSNHLNKKTESSWTTQSQMSGYNSKRENTSRENRMKENFSSKAIESAWDGPSATSVYDSNEESAPPSNNRSHEMGATRRPNEARKFDYSKPDISRRNSVYEINFSEKKTDLSSLFRVKIRENDKFEVKLAETGPPAVLIMQESDSFNSMINVLQEFNLKPMEDFCKGHRCVVKKTPDDYGTWYRGLIVEDDPLVVKFIDFSYERVQVRRDDVRIIPEKFTSMNPFCYPVNFLNASIDEVNKLKNVKFEVVFISKEYGTWNVELLKKPREDEVPDVARKESDSHIMTKNFHRSFTDLKVVLKKGEPMKVYVAYVDERSKKIFITIKDKLQKFLNLIGEILASLPELKEFRLNTICLAPYGEGWYRAKIVSVNPLEVYFVDFGNVEPAEKSDLKMLPEEFQKMDPFVVPVQFENGSMSGIDAEETVEIIPIEEKSETGIWIVKKYEVENESVDSAEEFDNESYAPKVALGEIIKVQVTHKVSNAEYYVGPKNMDELLRMNITNKEVEKLSPLETPLVGTLCVKMYDSVWCRAKIVNLKPLTIYYLDFGNEEEVSMEELYPLPERLQDIPPVAFKIHMQEPTKLPEYKPVRLKKVTEKYWTTVNEY